MGASFKLFGKGLAEELLHTVSHPLAGLFITMAATALIQSSSTTTTIIVTLVAAGQLSLPMAIPMIMGANIGTTVTNIIVSLGHITRKVEFRRAFTAATMHDFFNILAVIVLFPIEMQFHIIQKSAVYFQTLFFGFEGGEFTSPLKMIMKPVIHMVQSILESPLWMLALAFLILFFSLHQIMKVMKSLIIGKVENLFDQFLFRNAAMSLLVGLLFTILVQSSSVTTSLIVPLVGAGLLTARKVFPYTLGANLGTTITAILASFATMNPVAITVAFSHVLFNIFGIVIFYPLKELPIRAAEILGNFAIQSKKNVMIVIVLYSLLFFGPLLAILLRRLLG
jgi:solute carrier family 34 (sodium-dependent phosphate cotransporter)